MRVSKNKSNKIAIAVFGAAIVAGIVLMVTFRWLPWPSNRDNRESAGASEPNGIGESDTPGQISGESHESGDSAVDPRDLLKDIGTKRKAKDAEPFQAQEGSAPASGAIVGKVLSAVESNDSTPRCQDSCRVAAVE